MLTNNKNLYENYVCTSFLMVNVRDFLVSYLSATKLTLELLNSCKNIKRPKIELVVFLEMKQTGN